MGSPPHTRGILIGCLVLDGVLRLTPAHAGNTHRLPDKHLHIRAHPRTRGEYAERDLGVTSDVGSPPHTRGILMGETFKYVAPGLTPAHAGNTKGTYKSVADYQAHPRTRGEYYVFTSGSGNGIGSPPHTRGIPKRAKISRKVSRLTPAHAGNTVFQGLT